MKRARLIVDGMNVIGSRPDRWWKDRTGAMRRLVRRLEDYARAEDTQITVVFDSAPFDLAPPPGSGVLAVFATPAARNAADDEIVRIVESDAEPDSLQVVTSDAALAARVEALGATVLTAGGFRNRLEEAASET
jgi:predicted RNA-binding protein with PIN domain